jgi:DNA-binding MurR/RpiR family transcriptional regulator
MSISTVKGLEIAKSAGATTICITSFIKSMILKHADIRLITSATSAFDGGHTIYDQSMLSTISQLLVLDMLYASYAAMNYNKSVKILEKTWSSVKFSRLK